MSITWDSEVKGFGVRLTAAGARAFGLTVKMERFYTQEEVVASRRKSRQLYSAYRPAGQ
jgi:hypothetical protein